MRVQQLDLPAAFASLHSRPEGLTGAEAATMPALEEARTWVARRA